MESGWVREYWNDGDIDELESLTLEASAAMERGVAVAQRKEEGRLWEFGRLIPVNEADGEYVL